MIRKLSLLAAMVITAFAFSTAPASALVVEKSGANEITANTTISIHTILPNGFELSGLKCNHHWTGFVGSSGWVYLTDIEIDGGPGTVGLCNAANDCGDAGWNGLIEEDGGPWEFSLHLSFCISGQGGPTDGVVKTIECELTDTEVHCGGTHDGAEPDHPEDEAGIGLIQGSPTLILPFFVEGEGAISARLGLMHEG